MRVFDPLLSASVSALARQTEHGVPNIFEEEEESPASPSTSQRGSPSVLRWLAEVQAARIENNNSCEIEIKREEMSEEEEEEINTFEPFVLDRPIKIEPISPPPSPMWMAMEEEEDDTEARQEEMENAEAGEEEEGGEENIFNPPVPAIRIRNLNELINGDFDDLSLDSGFGSDVETIENIRDDGADPNYIPEGKYKFKYIYKI